MSESPKVTHPPRRIWLNFGEIEEDVDFAKLRVWDGITWCDIAQGDADIEYVLASDLAAAIARAERAEAALQRIALLDPADTDEGFNEWGEAACYVEAKDIADAALAAKETKDA